MTAHIAFFSGLILGIALMVYRQRVRVEPRPYNRVFVVVSREGEPLTWTSEN